MSHVPTAASPFVVDRLPLAPPGPALDGNGGAFYVAASSGSTAQLLHFGPGALSSGPSFTSDVNLPGNNVGVSVAVRVVLL